MSIHSLELHKRRRNGRVDETVITADNEWLVTKFNVREVVHYRLHHRVGKLDVSSVFTYTNAKATLVGFCVMSIDSKAPFSRAVEKMKHLQKLLEVMQGQDDAKDD